jgi:hypothetical protein
VVKINSFAPIRFYVGVSLLAMLWLLLSILVGLPLA